jgi:hypothetical protein
MVVITVMFILSAITTILITIIGFTLFTTVTDLLVGYRVIFSDFLNIYPLLLWIAFPFYNVAPSLLGRWTAHTISGVFLLSTLTGIVWVLLFSLAVIASNFSMNITGIGPWLKAHLDTRKHPYRSMGLILVPIISCVCLIYHLIIAVLSIVA